MGRTLLFAVALTTLPAGAVAPPAPPALQVAQASAATADGEVRKIDREAGKITLRHGAIPSLDMPPMTMVFRVADRTLIDRINPGDKVRFTFEKIGGQYTVTRIEPAERSVQ